MSTPHQLIEQTTYFLKVGTLKQYALVTGCVTGYQSNTTPGQAAKFGEKMTTGYIGGTIHRRGRQSDLELFTLQTDNFVATGPGLDIQKSFNTCVGLTQAGQAHLRRSSSL
jgi:hypothetical protein